MDSIIKNLLDQFNKSYPISQVLCPYCIYDCSATAKYCSKFDLHSNKTTFQVKNKKFKIMAIDFTCCDKLNFYENALSFTMRLHLETCLLLATK